MTTPATKPTNETPEIAVGQRIRFLHTLQSDADEESPGCLFARKGSMGTVTRVGGCWEGYWVRTDHWAQPFGCEAKDFEVITASPSSPVPPSI